MTQNRLYTVILDYKGGTYIAQVSADSPAAALPIWLSQIKNDALAEWEITRKDLISILKSEHVVPIDGCVNVWCTSGSARGNLALINVIATDGS